ncbi:type VI secretion system tube protein Hcp [Piscinibacter sakaiensis]|uniref:Uncharacterized protein ImpD n=1 Tax=Piscinibacter sakaiensis TaxID=1547922 RepID=A0A0K8NWX4_PISS1|nr:type VI secretion system tube protein Hcp [Piscinibacter sakaiensis]GAP34881.1 uncharacterized protein ImpD [Piscinibacter sakaiensis]
MAMDMFLKIEGGKYKVTGESRDKTHVGEIDVLAWSWGLSQSGTAHLGGGAGAGKANFQDLSITKYIDNTSHNLFAACATGDHFTKATLICRKAGTTPLEYVKITMDEVLISSLSTGGSGGEDRLTENVSLNFAKIKFEYVEQDAQGKPKTPNKEFTYSIAENVAG